MTPRTRCGSLAGRLKTANDYYCSLGVTYEPFNCTSGTSIDVLPALIGKPWNDIALGYVHGLRPSSIRVGDGCVKANSQRWRVTVVVSDQNVIKSIKQEVEVGLPAGIDNGHELNLALNAP